MIIFLWKISQGLSCMRRVSADPSQDQSGYMCLYIRGGWRLHKPAVWEDNQCVATEQDAVVQIIADLAQIAGEWWVTKGLNWRVSDDYSWRGMIDSLVIMRDGHRGSWFNSWITFCVCVCVCVQHGHPQVWSPTPVTLWTPFFILYVNNECQHLDITEHYKS